MKSCVSLESNLCCKNMKNYLTNLLMRSESIDYYLSLILSLFSLLCFLITTNYLFDNMNKENLELKNYIIQHFTLKIVKIVPLEIKFLMYNNIYRN